MTTRLATAFATPSFAASLPASPLAAAAYPVGYGTPYEYFCIQIHYQNFDRSTMRDASGVEEQRVAAEALDGADEDGGETEVLAARLRQRGGDAGRQTRVQARGKVWRGRGVGSVCRLWARAAPA